MDLLALFFFFYLEEEFPGLSRNSWGGGGVEQRDTESDSK